MTFLPLSTLSGKHSMYGNSVNQHQFTKTSKGFTPPLTLIHILTCTVSTFSTIRKRAFIVFRFNLFRGNNPSDQMPVGRIKKNAARQINSKSIKHRSALSSITLQEEKHQSALRQNNSD